MIACCICVNGQFGCLRCQVLLIHCSSAVENRHGDPEGWYKFGTITSVTNHIHNPGKYSETETIIWEIFHFTTWVWTQGCSSWSYIPLSKTLFLLLCYDLHFDWPVGSWWRHKKMSVHSLSNSFWLQEIKLNCGHQQLYCLSGYKCSLNSWINKIWFINVSLVSQTSGFKTFKLDLSFGKKLALYSELSLHCGFYV